MPCKGGLSCRSRNGHAVMTVGSPLQGFRNWFLRRICGLSGSPWGSGGDRLMATMMDHKLAERLEKEIEEAIVDVICRLGLRRLPLLPSHHPMREMAKAAVAVCETAVKEDAVASPPAREADSRE